MKRLRRVIAVGVVGVFASVMFAVQAPADHTEPRLTLSIAPDKGLPGQNIHAIVPAEYRETCLSGSAAATAIAAAFTSAAAGNPALAPIIGFMLVALTDGALTSPEQLAALTELLNSGVLFVLAFVDPVTQDPVVDEITGEEAIAFWDPITGEGDILAPYVNPRPATYFVAAVCLGLKDPAALQAAVVAAANALAPTFAGCVGQTPPFSSPECRALIETTLEDMVRAMIDEDPDVAWVAPFCLLNDDLRDCAVAAPPVPAAPTFAG